VIGTPIGDSDSKKYGGGEPIRAAENGADERPLELLAEVLILNFGSATMTKREADLKALCLFF
jgi:hypothetical protein